MGTTTTGDPSFCNLKVSSPGDPLQGRLISLETKPEAAQRAPLRTSRGVDNEGSGAYTVYVKNITVSVDDETYRRARIKAAQRDTSLSALVRRFLVQLASEESAERSLERRERDLRAQIRDFSARDRLSREDVHVRRR